MADQTDRQKRLLRRRRRLSSAVLPPVVEVNDANKRCELTVEWQERERGKGDGLKKEGQVEGVRERERE